MDVSGDIHAMVVLTPGKGPQYPLNGRISGTQRRPGSFGEEKNIFSLLVFQPLVVHAMGYSANWLHFLGSLKCIRILRKGRFCKTGVERVANAAGVLSES